MIRKVKSYGGWGILELHEFCCCCCCCSHAPCTTFSVKSFVPFFFSVGQNFGRSLYNIFCRLMAVHEMFSRNFRIFLVLRQPVPFPHN